MIRETNTCEVSSTKQAVLTAIDEGEYKPEIGLAKAANLNGTNASKPSKTKFSGASAGELHSELGGESSATGILKYLGYKGQELITVEGTAEKKVPS